MMVLVLMIVLVTTLASVAMRSMQTTHEAVVSVSQLQQRVGMTSCRESLLNRADFVFRAIDGQRRDGLAPQSPEAARITSDFVVLGDQRFDLVMSDENSKINLNTVNYMASQREGASGATSGQQKVTDILRRSLSVEDTRALALRPAQSSSENALLPAYRSWGEVFDFGAILRRSRDGQIRLDFTKSFTLWGSGQLNIQRAEPSAITQLAETVVTAAEAKKILTKIQEGRDVDLSLIISQEVKLPLQQQKLNRLIGKSSFSFSLFIDVNSPQSRSRKLFVSAPDINGTQQTLEFVFH